MAVTALLALGTPAVLAGGLSTTMNIAMANMPVQPKVSWGLCMAGAHFVFGAPIKLADKCGVSRYRFSHEQDFDR